MFVKYLSFVCLLLAACGNKAAQSETVQNKDSVAHAGHDLHNNTHMDETMAITSGETPVSTMHAAMSGMMTQMHALQPTGDADHDFATLMKLHHQSAVEMAGAQVAGGKDAVLKALAQQMVADQQKEIAQFDQFLSAHKPAGDSDYGRRAKGMMTEMEHTQMNGSSVDTLFARMMIPHHQDGVKMAQAYLKEAKNETLMAVARNIIATQPKEVTQLQQWLGQ